MKYNSRTAFSYFTDRNGNLTRAIDSINNIQYNSVFDTTGRLVRTTANSTTAASNKKFLHSVEYGYDLNNNITKLTNKTPNATITNQYTYGKDNLLTKYKMVTGKAVDYSYDGLNRLTKTSVSTTSPLNTSYTYYDSARGAGYTTNLLETETIGGVTYKYEYDTLGNITDIYRKDGTAFKSVYKYEYDAMNQLTYVYDIENKLVYSYGYDAGGNLLQETVDKLGSNGIPVSTKYNRYTYGDSNWTDKLTSYNGQTITYDAIGNPLSYRDGIAMTWKNGRQLATLNNDKHSVSYSYDSNSVRVSKTVDGVKYTYDAWGNVLSVADENGNAITSATHVGNPNPFRYRGYYYDTESG